VATTPNTWWVGETQLIVQLVVELTAVLRNKSLSNYRRIRMFKSGLLLTLLTAASLQAGVIASVTGPENSGIGNRVFATSWTQTSNFSDVTITADVFGVPQAGVTATAWLTTAIGPTATIANQIATAPITSNTIFSGLTLAPQTYFLVLLFNSGGNAAGWWATNSPTLTTAPGVTIGASYLGTFLDFPSFGPSETMSATTDFRFLFSVSNTSSVPEPSSFLLFATALSILAVFPCRRTRLG
jgi:hypothetical protein